MVVAISKASDQPAPSLDYSMTVKLLTEQRTAQACLSLHFSKYYTVGNHMPRSKCLYIFTKKQDSLGLELQCILKVKEYLSYICKY